MKEKFSDQNSYFGCFILALVLVGLVYGEFLSPHAKEYNEKISVARKENCMPLRSSNQYGVGFWDVCEGTNHLWSHGSIYEPVGTYRKGTGKGDHKFQLEATSFSPRITEGTRDINNHCHISRLSNDCDGNETWVWAGGTIYEKMGEYDGYKITKLNPITDEEKARGAEMEKTKDFPDGGFFDPTTAKNTSKLQQFFGNE